MTVDPIRTLLKMQPFFPFLIRMSNGQVYFVKHPEMIMKSNVIFGELDSDDFQFLALLHIAAVESLAVAA